MTNCRLDLFMKPTENSDTKLGFLWCGNYSKCVYFLSNKIAQRVASSMGIHSGNRQCQLCPRYGLVVSGMGFERLDFNQLQLLISKPLTPPGGAEFYTLLKELNSLWIQ